MHRFGRDSCHLRKIVVPGTEICMTQQETNYAQRCLTAGGDASQQNAKVPELACWFRAPRVRNRNVSVDMISLE